MRSSPRRLKSRSEPGPLNVATRYTKRHSEHRLSGLHKAWKLKKSLTPISNKNEKVLQNKTFYIWARSARVQQRNGFRDASQPDFLSFYPFKISCWLKRIYLPSLLQYLSPTRAAATETNPNRTRDHVGSGGFWAGTRRTWQNWNGWKKLVGLSVPMKSHQNQTSLQEQEEFCFSTQI